MQFLLKTLQFDLYSSILIVAWSKSNRLFGEMSEWSMVQHSKPKAICGNLNSESVDMTHNFESV